MPALISPGTYYVLLNQNNGVGCGNRLNDPILPVVRAENLTKYDFYQAAQPINGGAPLTISGEYRGDWDDYTCATRTANDRLMNDMTRSSFSTLRPPPTCIPDLGTVKYWPSMDCPHLLIR